MIEFGSSARLAPAVKAFVDDEDLPGASVAIVQAGREPVIVHAGLADRSQQRPVTDGTAFRIGSVSKTFTSWAIVALRDAGGLSLEDPLIRYLPELRGMRAPFGPVEAITIRRLLQHHAGLPAEAPSSDLRRWAPASIDAVLERPMGIEVVGAPGAGFRYSNLGFDLLGEIISRAAGVSYGDALTGSVMRPLGMGRTRLYPTAAPAELLACGYDPIGEDGTRAVATPPPDTMPASGGWWSTAHDLSLWLRLHVNGPGGAAETDLPWSSIQEMHRPSVVTRPDLSGAYGLGWRVARRGGRLLVGHGGLTRGFESCVAFDPTQRVGVVVLLNGIGREDPATRLADRLLGIDDGPRPAPAVAPMVGLDPRVDVPGDDTSDRRTGEYREVGFEMRIRVEATGDGLVLIAPGEDRATLTPTADPDRFVVGGGGSAGEALVFLRRADGSVDAVNLAGYPMIRTT